LYQHHPLAALHLKSVCRKIISNDHRWIEARTIKAAKDSAVGISSFNWAGGGPNNPDFRWVWNNYRHRNWKEL